MVGDGQRVLLVGQTVVADGQTGRNVLAVNGDESARARDRYLDRVPLELTILDDSARKAVERYQIEAMPTSVVVDREGQVHAIHAGFRKAQFRELVAQVEALLQ